MPITSSSTSSSRSAGPDREPWTSFLRVLAAATALLFLGLAAAAILLDPYDTGRFALLRLPGVPEQGPRTANASRGRDPAFDGAILGNSHIQLVSPEALRRATAIPFVSLIVPATGPKEQFVLLDYFLAHRARPARALVLGLDQIWCRPDLDPQNDKPFPSWLYDPDPVRYVAGLIRYNTLERLLPRLQRALHLGRRVSARPDGYWDYERYRTWRAEVIAAQLAAPADPTPANPSGRFPSIERLGRRLAMLPPDTAVVLVRPPVYRTALSAPGSAQAEVDQACRAALAALAERRPRTILVDWRTERAENGSIENYFDHTHYRASLARLLEEDIARALIAALGR